MLLFVLLAEDSYLDQLKIGKKERGVVVVAYFRMFPLKLLGSVWRVVSV